MVLMVRDVQFLALVALMDAALMEDRSKEDQIMKDVPLSVLDTAMGVVLTI